MSQVVRISDNLTGAYYTFMWAFRRLSSRGLPPQKLHIEIKIINLSLFYISSRAYSRVHVCIMYYNMCMEYSSLGSCCLFCFAFSALTKKRNILKFFHPFLESSGFLCGRYSFFFLHIHFYETNINACTLLQSNCEYIVSGSFLSWLVLIRKMLASK